jgi:TonB dependent receptor-like, beta-barrel/Carboxypeptidase regulatory-like domain
LKNKRVFCLVALVLVSLLLAVNQGFAQKQTGAIRGTVKDEAGESLPGVAVELKGPALMGTRTTTTDASGEFRFAVLPIGADYELTFTLQGFQPTENKNLRVTIGGTIVLDIVLKPAAISTELTVTAEAPLVDVTKSSFSSNFNAQTLDTVPTRRYTFFDMVQASPGITNESQEDSRASAFGSERKSNAYYINGLDISAPSTGAAWPWPMPDIIQELEVTGIGAPAEYGNFEGAVINVVSKSGSNAFHGAAKLFLQTDGLTANNTPDEQWPYHRDKWHDAVFVLGGPIIKDKLWFFGAIQHQIDSYSGVGADPAYPVEYRMTPTGDLKVDYQATKKDKLSLFAHYENYYSPGTPTEFTPVETVSAEAAPAIAPTLEWLHMVSDNTYFEVKVGGFYTYLKWDPVNGDMTTPGHLDWGTGYASVNALNYYHWKTNRTQANANISHFADNFLHGNHEFKTGVQYSHGYSDFIWGYIGGVEYYDYMNEPYEAYFRNPSHYGGMTDQVGIFGDDSWEISDRLTANLGLRLDYNHCSIPDFEELDANENPTGNKIPGIPDVANWWQLSPRIGLNYQLTSDRKTLLRVSFGRYTKGLVIGDIEDATPAQAILYVYGYNPDTQAYDDFIYDWNPLTGLGVDKNLKPPHTWQFSAALEREIFQDFSLSVTYVYKDNRGRIDRLNTGAQYEEIPFLDASTGKTIMVYNQLEPINNFYLITNPGDEITYNGLMIVANKRFSHNFQFYGSFTYSKAWWKKKGFKDKNELINAEGPLRILEANDRRWMFKLGGVYMAPWGIVLGTNIIYQQGAPWERTAFVEGLNQGGRTIMAEQRGSRRTPDQFYFDIKVEKAFKIATKYSLEFSLDIINVPNSDVNLFYASTIIESPSWMVPTDIILPRRALLGVKFVF